MHRELLGEKSGEKNIICMSFSLLLIKTLFLAHAAEKLLDGSKAQYWLMQSKDVHAVTDLV